MNENLQRPVLSRKKACWRHGSWCLFFSGLLLYPAAYILIMDARFKSYNASYLHISKHTIKITHMLCTYYKILLHI